MLPHDPKLRSLYRLLALTNGSETERVLDAIHQRRRQLEREHNFTIDSSAFGGRPYDAGNVPQARSVWRSRSDL